MIVRTRHFLLYEVHVISFRCLNATFFFFDFQDSSIVIEWSLNKATNSVDQVVKYPLPYIKNQLLAIDHVLCRSLDLTELNLPVLTKTPQEVTLYLSIIKIFNFSTTFNNIMVSSFLKGLTPLIVSYTYLYISYMILKKAKQAI